MHEGCAVNHQEPAINTVVNASNVVVNARSKDRHKKTEARAQYIAQKMREHRARKRTA